MEIASLSWISAFFVCSGIIIAIVLACNVMRNKQTMRIMNIVWVLTGLWGHYMALAAYYGFGKQKKVTMEGDMKMDMPMDQMNMEVGHSNWQSIALSALHCGAGCTLADILGEGFTYFVPMSIWVGWTIDFILALIIGIYFQYSAIREMERISSRDALWRACKADFLSLVSWQIGMYGWMAIVYFVLFKDVSLNKGSWIFWFMMQIAMFFGFCFAYPMNALLIKWGIKKGM